PEEPPEIPLVMAPLPVSLEPAIADAVPSGAPSEESAGEPAAPVAVATAAAEPANPWDGHSGITEAVDLDNALGQPSAMDVLLAGPVRRPHVENGLRGEPDVAA